jgi:signal transduction histidine kinase
MAEGISADVDLHLSPQERWFDVRAYASPNGIVVYFRDVSEGKQLERELRGALASAHAANRASSEFLAMMSHELRTPMQAVLGYADLLLAGPADSLTSEQTEDVRCIQQGAKRIIALVDQMLDLSRLQAGRLEFQVKPVDLAEVVEQVRQDVAPQAAVKSLTLAIDIPASLPRVRADAMRLRQILLNLIGNAVKFTDKGSVRLSARESEAGIEVAVQDTGIGIPEAALEHIFEEFRQADSVTTTRRYGGAGLGLAIARNLAEQQGGTISVKSTPKVGSTFTLTMPAVRGRRRGDG